MQLIGNMRRSAAMLLMAGIALAFAGGARANGTLTHLSGQVSVQKADGTTVAGAPGMQVLPGDTLMTGATGFARMETTDGGEMVLRPDSQMKIEKYNYDVAKPADDSFVFKVLKGGFRTVTGLISKRGNREAYQGRTETATIGIRGTQFDLRVCQANCGALPAGTYVAVRFGSVSAGNNQGSMDLKAGQVAHVPSGSAPILLPRDPGIGFTPPASIPKLDEKKKKEKESAEAKASDKKDDVKKDDVKKDPDKKDADKKEGDKKDDAKKGDSKKDADAGDKKSGDSKPAASSDEVKDSKSQDSKPQDAKPQESKTQESKAPDSKPVEASPAPQAASPEPSAAPSPAPSTTIAAPSPAPSSGGCSIQ